jgi:hypothetical protein
VDVPIEDERALVQSSGAIRDSGGETEQRQHSEDGLLHTGIIMAAPYGC